MTDEEFYKLISLKRFGNFILSWVLFLMCCTMTIAPFYVKMDEWVDFFVIIMPIFYIPWLCFLISATIYHIKSK